MKNRKPVKSLRIGLDLAEHLVELEGAKASVLAERLDMPRSTVHDYLRTLTEEGYAINDDGEYRLTFRFLELGGELRHQQELFHIARSELRSLADETEAHASLVLEERGFGVVVFTASGGNTQGVLTYDGAHFYLHSAASGKAMLAHFPEKKVVDIIERRGLKQITDETITDRNTLMAELDQIREREYSIDEGEVLEGMRGIGTTIINQETDDVVGAISLYAPMKRPNIEELAGTLLEAANIIEVNHNYHRLQRS